MILTTALETLDLGDFAVEVEFVSDARIKRINAEHRGKPKPTDVLSFPTFEGRNGKLTLQKWEEHHLGSVVIATGVCARQAKEFQHPFAHEVARLLVHGICHLAGYDHERSARDETIMFKQEDIILDRVRATGALG